MFIKNVKIETIRDAFTSTGSPRGNTKLNAVFRFSAYFISIIINLLAIPFILKGIGVEAFGVVSVVNTLLSFMSITTISLTSTLGRNLTLSLAKGENELAQKELNTAFYGLLIIFTIAFLPLSIFCLFIDRLITIPPDIIIGTQILFFLAVLSFGFNAIAGALGATMFARNRLDLFSGASLARVIFFVSAIFVLFEYVEASLITYGVALLGGTIFLFALHFRIHLFLMPTIKISMKFFDRKTLVDIMSLGGWMILVQIGSLLFLQTDILVANRILGANAAGKFAAISVISMQLRALATLVSGLFSPNQVAIAAKVNSPLFGEYLFRSIRLTTLFMALLVGVFCGSALEVLTIWLGNDFSSLAPVAILLTIYLIPTLGVMPCWNALLAIGKIKVPAIVTLVMGGANVALGAFLAAKTNMGLMGIALAGCVMLTLRNIIFTPWYVSRVCDIKLCAFLRELVIGLIAGGAVYLATALIMRLIHPNSMIMLVLSLLLATVVSGLLLLPIGLRTIKNN